MRVHGMCIHLTHARARHVQTLKREARQKKKSAKEWAARHKSVASALAAKQEQRKKNLAERGTKAKNKAAKHQQARAGPRACMCIRVHPLMCMACAQARAGFEGKRSRFLTG